MLTQQRLKEVLHYDPETGIFTWKYRTDVPKCTNSLFFDKIAGYKNNQGYFFIRINRKLYRSQRLAWLYVHGKWPDNEIDHINGVRHDNRFENLRDVTKSINMQNQKNARKDCSLGFQGVHADHNKFQSRININGKRTNLGSFKTPHEAHKAYLEAKRKHHEGCTI